MTAKTVKEIFNQKPFRPLAIETVGGSWIRVESEEDVLIYTRDLNRPRVVVFDEMGSLYILEPEQISAIAAR